MGRRPARASLDATPRTTSAIGARARDESGIALVLALVIMFVLTTMVTGTIAFASANVRHGERAGAAQKADALVEAGVNNAVAVLAAAYATGTVPARNPPNLLPPRTSTYDGESVTWRGLFCRGATTPGCTAADRSTWRVTAVATVRNPTGPSAAGVKRTATVRIPVHLAKTKPANPIWSWVYSGGGPSAGTTGTSCDTVIGNQVRMLAPLYVVGNLCLENRAAIAQPAVPSVADCSNPDRASCKRLVVGGWLWQRSTQTEVGTATTSPGRLSEAYLASGCAASTSSTIAVTNPCGWDADRVYVVPSGRYTAIGAARLQPPAVSWDDYYAVASPGPTDPCATSSGTPPMFDTGDGLRNNSVAVIANLTPNASYTCKTEDGELSWNPATRTLTIAGTVFIDGSAEVDTGAVANARGWNPNNAVRYAGQGFLWVSGTFLIKNAILCATPTANWSGCDLSAWNPNTSAMGVAAGGSGGQVSTTTTGIEIRSGAFQGLLYATSDIVVLTTGRMQGPMISLTKVSVSQTGDLSFPPVAVIPGGAPGELPGAELGVVGEFGR